VALPDGWLNAASDAIKNQYTHVGLRNSGTELAGGSPAYARIAPSFGATAAGDSTAQLTFNVPAGSTVNQVAFYTASSGGTAAHVESVTPEVFAGQGTYTLNLTNDVD
jgi:hypothetical protein